MREIKFRAWDKRIKRMLYGDEDFDGFHGDEYEKSEWYPAWDILGIFTYFQYIAQNENFVVMQYTGLKDKNGKEIYEGDIFKPLEPFREWQLGVVMFRYCAFRVHTFLLNELRGEIIGNIYENPELLEDI